MINTLALDLEGTLISNAMSQIARPGLRAFLERCRELFARVVIYTAVDEPRFRAIAATLVREGEVPEWFADIEYIQWDRETKDLARIPGTTADQALLADDLREYVHAGQEAQWIPVPPFVAPYPGTDDGLIEVIAALKEKLRNG